MTGKKKPSDINFSKTIIASQGTEELALETIKRERKLSLPSETDITTGGKGSREACICGNQEVTILKRKATSLEPHTPKSCLEFADRRERRGVTMGLA